MRKKLIIILVIIVVLVIFFFPKSECGLDSSIAPFNKCRCDCLGFILDDPFDEPVLGQNINHRCYGIKTGETICEDNAVNWLISQLKTQPQKLVLDKSGYKIKIDETESLLYGVMNLEKEENVFGVNLGCVVNENNSACDEINYYDSFKLIPGEIKVSSFNITIDDGSLEPGAYIWKIIIFSVDNTTYDSRNVFIDISE